MRKTANNNSKTAVASVKVETYEQRLRNMQDTNKQEEKALLASVKSNLKSLKGAIEKTKDALEGAQERYDNMLSGSYITWSEITSQQVEIESLADGLNRLKALREDLFPNWAEVLTQD